jgi:hypothetical protein
MLLNSDINSWLSSEYLIVSSPVGVIVCTLIKTSLFIFVTVIFVEVDFLGGRPTANESYTFESD